MSSGYDTNGQNNQQPQPQAAPVASPGASGSFAPGVPPSVLPSNGVSLFGLILSRLDLNSYLQTRCSPWLSR